MRPGFALLPARRYPSCASRAGERTRSPSSADRESRHRGLLERFHGFHQVWERALAAHPSLAAFQIGRSRLPHLRRDLRCLGRNEDEIDALPGCRAAAELAGSEAAALGSVYVMEGSTRGGRVIRRFLAREPWAPPGGLAYFDPYEGRTDAMWRVFADWSERQAIGMDRHAVAAGARATFATLRDGLTT